MEEFFVSSTDDQLIRPLIEEELDNPVLWPRLTVAIGPSDRALPLVAKLSLGVEKERVSSTKVEAGWLFRDIEKQFEGKTAQQGQEIVSRLNAIEPWPLEIAYLLATTKVDNLLPYVCRLEAARIFHHVRVIEQLLFRLEEDSFLSDIKSIRDEVFGMFSKECDQAKIVALTRAWRTTSIGLIKSRRIEKRLVNLATIDKKTALSFGITGPALRACGVADDLRMAAQYFDYKKLGFSPVTKVDGDCWARLLVRLLEVDSSLNLLMGLLQHSPVNFFAGENLMQSVLIEAPLGQLAMTVCQDDENKLSRVAIRSPSFALTSALGIFLNNCRLDDVPIIVSSLGISMLEVDR